ncbi:rhomboid family intramembrane serine protease [Phragmitibacter flavus]|uniref:Rhomboid family intramembrane serine protease n=1 Tax=Phragmitibacter flavus TaxID=2576071 RepID=A0A5R8K818_9BACT|nr:rhomboid family intramembrane serine protease [Phragmitibacter flavus]TLD68494.1 rhomboid family intramembrane serine protease [Phragmitibacter flavus]
MLHDRDYMRGRQSPNWLQWMWSDAVTLLVVINVAVFLMQVFVNDGRPFEWGVLSMSALADGRVWTLFTHMFLHHGIFHILGNALMIFFIGKALQSLLGTRNLLYVYFLSGLGGAVMEMAIGWVADQPSAMVGASACAFGLLMGLAVMLPQEKITAMIYFIIPLRMKLWNLAMMLMGLSVVLALLQLFNIWDMQIAHFAHIGGGLTGWWFVRTLGYGGGPITYERLWQERQQREQSRELAGVRRKLREVTTRKSSDDLKLLEAPDTKDFIEREIDPILDKITAHGITSLTEAERELLQRARNEIINRDRH